MHGGMRRWRRSGIAVAVLALALAGCSPDDPTSTQTPSSATAVVTPSVEPSPTPTVEPTPTPTAAPKPALPPEMANGDEAGAIAAVKYFLELYAYAYGSGDTAAFAAMSEVGCDFCSNTLARIQELHDAGGYATGGEPEWIEGSDTVEALGNGVFNVNLTAVQTEMRTYSVAGVIQEDLKATTMEVAAGVRFTEGSWSVVALGGDVVP